jgi:hypothetical protein
LDHPQVLERRGHAPSQPRSLHDRPFGALNVDLVSWNAAEQVVGGRQGPREDVAARGRGAFGEALLELFVEDEQRDLAPVGECGVVGTLGGISHVDGRLHRQWRVGLVEDARMDPDDRRARVVIELVVLLDRDATASRRDLVRDLMIRGFQQERQQERRAGRRADRQTGVVDVREDRQQVWWQLRDRRGIVITFGHRSREYAAKYRRGAQRMA